MGVPLLNSFITRTEGLRKDHHLRDTNVVIDGNNLMFHIYCQFNKASNNDFLFGGNGPKLRQYFTTFFDNLIKCKISPVCIFDGGSLNSNLEESRNKRFEEVFGRSMSISKNPPQDLLTSHPRSDVIFPHLLRNIFVSVAKEFQFKQETKIKEASLKQEVKDIPRVKVFQTRQDSDQTVARLANELKCPLISNDSDFLIMSIDEGVIDGQTFNWENIITKKNKSYIECLIYRVSDFVQHFNIKPELLPIFASIMGNDVFSGEVFDGLIGSDYDQVILGDDHFSNYDRRIDKMKVTLHWLSKKFFSAKHAEDYILNYLRNNGESKRKFRYSMNSYESSNKTFFRAFLDLDNDEENLPIDTMVKENRVPKWFLLEYFKCQIDPVLFGFLDRVTFYLRPLVEDYSLESCFECVYEMNGYIAGLLRRTPQDLSPIRIVSRNKSRIEEIEITPKTRITHMAGDGQQLPILSELRSLTNIESKNLFFSILRVDEKFVEHLKESLTFLKIDEKDIEFWSYFLIVFRYWKNMTKLYLRPNYFTFVSALVKSIIYYRHHSLIKDEFDGLTSVTKNKFNPKITHYLCEFQIILTNVDRILALLGYPIESVKLPHFLDGILYYNLFEEIAAKRLNFYAFKEHRLNTLNTFIVSSLS